MKEKKILSSLLVKLLFGVILLGGLLVSPIKEVEAEAAEVCVYEKEEYFYEGYGSTPIVDGESFKIAVLQGEEYVLRPYPILIEGLLDYKPITDASYEWVYGSGESAQTVSTDNTFKFKEDKLGLYSYDCKITSNNKNIKIKYEIMVLTANDLQNCDKVMPSIITSVPATSKKITPIWEAVAEIGKEGDTYNYYLKENVDYKVTFIDKINPLLDKQFRYKFEYLGNFKNYGVSLDGTLSLNFDIKIKSKTVVINSSGVNYKPDIVYYKEKGDFKWHYYSDATCKKELSSTPKSAGIYYVRVSSGATYSNAVTLTILPATCSTVKVAAYTDKAVKLAWSKATGANYYRVFIKKNGKWQTVKNTKATSCVVNGLKGFTVYEFAVRPCYVNSNKKIVWAKNFTTKKVRTKVSAAYTPSVKVNNKDVIIKYKRPSAVNGFQVYISKNNGKYQLATTTIATTVYFGNRLPGTYKVRIRCYSVYKGKRYYGALSAPVTYKVK